jgi:hypothetical protein
MLLALTQTFLSERPLHVARHSTGDKQIICALNTATKLNSLLRYYDCICTLTKNMLVLSVPRTMLYGVNSGNVEAYCKTPVSSACIF